ncbi:hypothetical protein GCM10007424_27850 [Flavobacterium suaedae]|uniref:Uncharacterized protein n=1 Tax=Flavobacterium suaedae TaxID=1767027 RepID=A0ABQ1K2R3_9FLAO|nr:hypothetical protein [Flavobacterium suaedae]GGB86218.1 hypothetical protein GCM10007424_27850 [Flavobacterium suaedae]
MKNSIILLLIVISFISCTSDKVCHKHKINEFNKKITDTLYPVKEGSYAVKVIKVKGYANDSIYINGYKLYFKHSVDTVLQGGDYYGTHPAVFEFDPYKAKEGDLEIEFCIL